MATISAHYFEMCLHGAMRRGFARDPFLRRAGVDPALLDMPGARAGVEQMARLVRDIWVTLDDEFMGHTDHPVRSGAFAMMAEIMLHSDSVRDAMERGIAFYRLITVDITTVLQSRGAKCILRAGLRRPELDPDHYFIEFWLVIWHRMACWLAGETVPLKEASFSYPRPETYFEEFKYLFPCAHRFGRPACELLFDSSALNVPIVRTTVELREMVAKAPLDIMTIPASDHSLSRQVRSLLGSSAAGKFRPHRIEEVAAELGMSIPVLVRRLRHEGTNFRAITENIRRDMAIYRLRRTDASVERIAFELGYVETRSFTRAFSAWTGESPARFRRNLARG